MRVKWIGRPQRAKLFTIVLCLLSLASAHAANAAQTFTFDTGANGWSNEPTEAFSVVFAPGEGVGGGGALAVSATIPRNSYQLVHGEDPDWPAIPSFFKEVTVDVRLAPGVQIDPLMTGVKVRDGAGNVSNVYLASSLVDLGSGWTRIVMTPSNLTALPQSHDDVGINLHIGTTTGFAESFVMDVDNIAAVNQPAAVPALSPLTLLFLGVLLAAGGIIVLRPR